MDRIADFLGAHEFRALFLDLGWDRAHADHTFRADDSRELHFTAVAQKRGLVVLHCETDRAFLADRRALRHLQKQLLKVYHEHVVIFSCDEPPKQVWQWAFHRPDGQDVRHREHPFFSASPPPALLVRLEKLRFRLDEEEGASLVDARRRIVEVLDTEAEFPLFARKPKMARRSDELARQIQAGVPGAFDRFVLHHRPLAHYFARRYQRWYGLDPEDAEQIATVGLVIAAKRFQPERGYQFTTYAQHWIRQCCQRYGVELAQLIRVPTHQFWPCMRLARRLHFLEVHADPASRPSDFLAEIESDDELRPRWSLFQRASGVVPLPDSNQLIDRGLAPSDTNSAAELSADVRAAVECLHPRYAQILRMRYGIDCSPHTLEELGTKLGITRERVRQLQVKGEEKLRRLLKSWMPELAAEAVIDETDSAAAETPTHTRSEGDI